MNTVGMIHGRAVLPDSAEWLGLLFAVTVGSVPVPAGASPAIINRLHQRQREL